MATRKALTNIAKSYGCSSLLGTKNAKTTKGNKREVLTGILYMMPDDSLCPMSKRAGCRKACLVSAGLAAFTPGIGKARAGRTALFHNDRGVFIELLCKEIDALLVKAKKEGKQPAIRLNGTSDINWSKVRISETIPHIFALYPGVQFYDYTKRVDIIRDSVDIPNWHVTASYSSANNGYANVIAYSASKYGTNMAVVFRSKEFPSEFLGRPVVDGDETDLRFLDPASVVVALSAKGQARKDISGFVIDSSVIATDAV